MRTKQVSVKNLVIKEKDYIQVGDDVMQVVELYDNFIRVKIYHLSLKVYYYATLPTYALKYRGVTKISKLKKILLDLDSFKSVENFFLKHK